MSTEALPTIQLSDAPSATMPSSGSSYQSTGGVVQAPASMRAVSAELLGEGAYNAPVVSEPAPPQTGRSGSMGSSDSLDSLSGAVDKALSALDLGPDAPEFSPARPNRAAAKPQKAAEDFNEAYEETAPRDLNAGDPTNELGYEPEVDTTGWTTSAARAFERVKGQRKQLLSETEQLKQTVAQYEAQMNELKGSLQASDSIEALQTRVRDFEQMQMFTNLEGTRAYQEAISAPMQYHMDLIDAIADRAGVPGEALFDLIVLPEDSDNHPQVDADGFPYRTKDQRIEALLANVSPRDRAAVFATMNDMDQLMAKRAEMFYHADQAFREAQEYEAQKMQVAAANSAKQRRLVSNTVVDRIAERVPFIQAMDGLDLARLKEEVSSTDPSTLHPVDAQYHAATAKLFPFVVNDLMRAQAEIENLVTQLAAFEDAEPGAGVGSTSGFTGSSVRGSVPYGNAASGNTSFAQAVELALAGR